MKSWLAEQEITAQPTACIGDRVRILVIFVSLGVTFAREPLAQQAASLAVQGVFIGTSS
jgi:hypothetical protein